MTDDAMGTRRVHISGSALVMLRAEDGAAPYMRLLSEAARAAVADAGMARGEIDGLVLSTSIPQPFERKATEVAEYLGITPCYATTAPYGGRPATDVFQHARAAIAAGLASNVLVLSADNFAARRGIEGAIELYMTSFDQVYERPFGPLSPTAFALMATRYLHDYGASVADLARVAVDIRGHAALHPDAQLRTPTTVDEVLSGAPISSPLTRPMVSLISRGGAQGFVVTSAPRGGRAVTILGYGESAGFMNLPQAPDLTSFESIRIAAGQALGQAGVSVHDLDFLEVYDPAPIVPLILLEDLGVVGRGEAPGFVADGNARLGGRLPLVTHGGTLGFRHPGMGAGLDAVHEAVVQLRHEAGARQVAGASVGMIHGQGSWTANNGLLVLGRS